MQTLDDAVRVALPSAPRRNNPSLFLLARAIKTLELKRPVSMQDRMTAFDQWFAQTKALGFIRHDRDQYLFEFMNALKTAIHPLGETPLEAAWKKAQIEPFPREANYFEKSEPKLLVALCWELHTAGGGQPWYLACRSAAKLLNLSHVATANWLAGFVALGILKVAEHSTKSRATRYLWPVKTGKDDNP